MHYALFSCYLPYERQRERDIMHWFHFQNPWKKIRFHFHCKTRYRLSTSKVSVSTIGWIFPNVGTRFLRGTNVASQKFRLSVFSDIPSVFVRASDLCSLFLVRDSRAHLANPSCFAVEQEYDSCPKVTLGQTPCVVLYWRVRNHEHMFESLVSW